MTDAVKEEFIKLYEPRPTELGVFDRKEAMARWDAKLEGFRLARSNGVPAGEADRRDGQRYRWLRENWYYEFEEPADPAVFPECARVVHTVDMEQMDEAVDNAIAEQKETK